MSICPPESPTVADVLRGDRSTRPGCDRTIAPGLRAELEDQIHALLSQNHRDDVLTVHPGHLRDVGRTADLGRAPTGRLRGVLVAQILRLLVVGHDMVDPFADAFDAWRTNGVGDELVNFAAQLGPDDLARLATDVTAHAVTLTQHLGRINPRWRPRTDVSSVSRLAGGTVVLRDRYDLVVGSTNTAQASIALFDVTTSPFGVGHERVLRYHALSETLRSGVAPLRVVSLSTATGDLWSIDVDTELLRRALGELTEVITEKWITS
jgi:hypothetical protein